MYDQKWDNDPFMNEGVNEVVRPYFHPVPEEFVPMRQSQLESQVYSLEEFVETDEFKEVIKSLEKVKKEYKPISINLE